MSKTIKQIADEIGVSKQAVQKRLSREPLCISIQPYISTVGGIKYIDTVGENLVKSAFCKNNRQPVADNLSIDKSDSSLTNFQSVIDVLNQQLEVKDRLIEQLRTELADERKHSREISDKLVTLTDQSQKLQLAQMTVSDTDLIEDNQDSKKHWSLFRKRRK